MLKPSFDPGLTQQVTGNLRRAINRDGSFNVQRRGGSWRHIHPYLHMINMGWWAFLGTVFGAYLIVNTIFAALYYALGPGEIQGVDAPSKADTFFHAFFFSAHTLTTVGYGNFAPVGMGASILSALEALVGLMAIALATGLLFGRFSRPSAKVGFSENALIAPFQAGQSLQFRVVNLRSNVLIELQASVMLMTVETNDAGRMTRNFQILNLERDKIYFFPLTWTVVHPLDESSPLFGKSRAELERLQAEILILLKGFDETFSQTVNAKYSYRFDELVWGATFNPAFRVDEDGQMILNVDQISNYAAGA